jgi:signal transduction histidine kinase
VGHTGWRATIDKRAASTGVTALVELANPISGEATGPSDQVSDHPTDDGAFAGGRRSRRPARVLEGTYGPMWMRRIVSASDGGPVTAWWRPMGFATVVGLMSTVVWAATGGRHFWPGWVWFGLATPLAFWGGIGWALRARHRRPLVVQAVVSLLLVAVEVFVWLMTGLGYFWPIWSILGLGVALVAHAWVVPLFSSAREQALVERVDVLTRTRRGVLDVQAAELQRVERDLHDGAQARLVSLGMSLGMADELLDSDPAEARRLLAEARTATGAALADLRDLVRGIHPPVLADRGVDGAIQALVLAVPIPVAVSIDLPEGRLPPPVESAAYFAVAEALANLVKHSRAETAWIRVQHADARLSMVVGDNGAGGANPAQGTGLAGIERRLAAFDGTLSVSSPPGGPTVVSMEVPCESSSPKTSPS